jgi:hypothetical protein
MFTLTVQAFAQSAPEPEQPRKPPGQIIKYGKEFLLAFMDVSARQLIGLLGFVSLMMRSSSSCAA